jgi:nucleoside-diphosphate-sugar epimerase
MRILVIGGTGFISAHVVRQLVSHEHSVTVFHRGSTQALLPDSVCHIVNPQSAIPIEVYPAQILDLHPDIVILAVTMGAPDAAAAMKAFADYAGRIVLLSSGDVYQAYGRFAGIEGGAVDNELLKETAPLRSVLFPYRGKASSRGDLNYWYEKILAERAVLSIARLPGTVLRLPKVYGPGGNQNLATVYRNSLHREWRWTHGYVENVAAAIVLAATHPAAMGGIYNIGESYTPTIGERLAWLPLSTSAPDLDTHFDFRQNVAFDTSRIRCELGYREIISEKEGALRTLESSSH